MRSALIASLLTSNDRPAFVLGNLVHGLTLAGNSEIEGNVVVGPRGVSTGSLRNVLEPSETPIRGSVIESSMRRQMLDTSMITGEVEQAKSLLLMSRRPRLSPDYSGNVLDTSGYVDLASLSDTLNEVFCRGFVMLGGTIMRRGPPLNIVALAHITLLPGLRITGSVGLYSRDSIVVPPDIKLTNCIIASCR